MEFFAGLKPELYIHGAKLRRDKKTGKRLWGLTFIVTLDIDLVLKCGGVIESAYGYILTLDNCVVEVLLNWIVAATSVDFFALIDDKKAALHLNAIDLEGLRLTRNAETVELWFFCEIENYAELHAFVKEFAFTRLWARFAPGDGHQGELEIKVPEPAPGPVQGRLIDEGREVLDAVDRLASHVRSGEVGSFTLSTAGMEPVVIDKAAAERIHRQAKAKKK